MEHYSLGLDTVRVDLGLALCVHSDDLMSDEVRTVKSAAEWGQDKKVMKGR